MNKKMNTLVNDVYTLTFGDAGENNVGMEILGSVGEVGSGFNENDLKKYKAVFEKIGCKCELVKLNDFMGESYSDEVDDAFVLVIRNGVVAFDASSECMKKEMRSFEWDKKYKDRRRNKVLNKLARWNVMFGEEDRGSDYEGGKGTIKKYFGEIKKVKNGLIKMLKAKGEGMVCEGNMYYDSKKCGIGWHGDSERKKVVGLRIGGSMVLKFRWFHKHKGVGKSFEVMLNDGDMYIMSEKSVGYDWKKSSIFTLRHSAGCNKYVKDK